MPAVHSQPLLGRARTSLEEAGAIVRQTLGMIRDRALVVPETNVMACLTDVAALVEGIGEPGLVIEVDVAPGLARLPCCPIGLRRAVLNLVFNGRDALESIGVVSIDARPASTGGFAAAVEIRVSDDGIGMSSRHDRARLRSLLHHQRRRAGRDVERFVREAGGKISIESAPGIGTTVAMRLPAIAWTGFSQQELD